VRRTSENGTRTFANLGLTQTLRVTDKWSVDAGLDHSSTVKDPGNTSINVNVPPASGGPVDFTAVSLGTTYREEKWSWTSRLEARYADNEDKWGVTTGAYGEPSDGLGLSAGAQILRNTPTDGPQRTVADLRLGVAVRPRNSRWTLLDRLDLILEDVNGVSSDRRTWRFVNNTNANHKFDRGQIALEYGAKYVRDDIEGDYYGGYTDLTGMEIRYDLHDRWDVGLRASMLHSWEAKDFDYSTGASVGVNVFDNAWLSVGYNFLGFEDEDFSKARFTAQGPYVQFRFKFDQDTPEDLLGLFGRSKTKASAAPVADERLVYEAPMKRSEGSPEPKCLELAAAYEDAQHCRDRARAELAQEKAAIAALRTEIATVTPRLESLRERVAALESEVDYFEALPRVHTVRRGESLSTISGQEGIYADPMKWRRIFRANREKIGDPNVIHPDMLLTIPRDWPHSHVVRSGESLWRIAGYWEIYERSMLWSQIHQANEDQISDPNLIHPGQLLVIPRLRLAESVALLPLGAPNY
jgi:nucleoid-associated protein YgaU